MVLVRLLDRYVVGQFLRVLAITLFALMVVFVMVHLMDHIDVYLDHGGNWPAVARYYLFEMPYNTLLTLPMAMLIATILSIGELGKHGELAAMKSSGISLYRIITPIILLAFVISLGTLALGESVVPRMNERAHDVYEKEVLGRGQQFENYRGNFVYQDGEGYTYIVRSLFVEDTFGSIDQVEIQRKLNDGTFLRINAPNMIWEPGNQRWVMRDGEIRVFPPDGDERMYTFMLLRSPWLDTSPKELLAEEKRPEEMGYFDLQQHIAERERLGVETRTQRVDLQMKLSYPFANLIIVLFGLAVVGSAAHASRQSGTVGFGMALFLTIVFWGFLRVSQGIGYGGGLEPPLAAWMANGVFGAVALVLLARART